MLYPNNGFHSYVEDLYKKHYTKPEKKFVVKVFKLLPVIVTKIVKDTGVELLLLLIFWFIIAKMSQGRDLIVSLFEPDGLYGNLRVVFTTLAVISYSVSMWIIPAFLFQWRERRFAATKRPSSPFRQHLFFVHRVLPMIPFWVLTSSLFNSGMSWLILVSLFVLSILYWFNHKFHTEKIYKTAIFIVGTTLITTTIYFFLNFQEEYTSMKVIFGVNLYLLSVLMFFIYHFIDQRILAEHALGDPKTNNEYQISAFKKYKINSITYLTCLILHIVVILLIAYRPWHFSIAPESVLLYIFSVYVFIIDLIVYLINVSPTGRITASFVALGVAAVVLAGIWKPNLSLYSLDENSAPTTFSGVRDDFEKRYNVLRNKILLSDSSLEYPILLVAGEGGGSRAGLWFSQNLINYDLATNGNIRDHIFSLSTVSGSSVGLSTVFTYWDKTLNNDKLDQRWNELPGKVFANNFVGSSIRGLLLTDLFKSFIPGKKWQYDRNSTLQDEEAYATEWSVQNLFNNVNSLNNIDDSEQTLKKDFMYFFYNSEGGQQKYRDDMPITLINTTRSNDGRRGIFSSIRLDDRYFYEAIDIIGYLYEDSICNTNGQKICSGKKKKVSLGLACNTSELFPLFSAPAYIENLGSFVDGGYHENSALKSTLDIYEQLKNKIETDKQLQNHKYHIYIVYLKNGSGEKDLYKPVESSITILQPLNAVFNQPFEGSASYFEEKARNIGVRDSNAKFIAVSLSSKLIVDPTMTAVTNANSKNESPNHKESLEKEILVDIRQIVDHPGVEKPDTTINFPLARWLSKTIIERIKLSASINNQPQAILDMLRHVNDNKPLNKSSFGAYREYYKLKVADSTVIY